MTQPAVLHDVMKSFLTEGPVFEKTRLPYVDGSGWIDDYFCAILCKCLISVHSTFGVPLTSQTINRCTIIYKHLNRSLARQFSLIRNLALKQNVVMKWSNTSYLKCYRKSRANWNTLRNCFETNVQNYTSSTAVNQMYHCVDSVT